MSNPTCKELNMQPSKSKSHGEIVQPYLTKLEAFNN